MRLSIANTIFCSTLLVCIFWDNVMIRSCDAFGLMTGSNSNSKVSVASTSTSTSSRQDFLAVIAGGLVATTATLSAPAAAWAKDDFTKGSKQDPAVQACLSQCVYDCTKPKGPDQISRAECIPICKKKCITAKSSQK